MTHARDLAAGLFIFAVAACGRAQAPARPTALIIVTNEDSGDLTLIDAATDSVVATIPVGKRPRGVKLSADGRRAFVALSGSPKCPPTMPDAECARLIADKTADGIGVIDLATRTLLRVLPGGSDPEQFDIAKNGNYLVVANEDAGRASFIDMSTGTVTAEVRVGGEPEGVRFSPDGAEVWITSEEEGSVHVLDAVTRTEKTVIRVGRRPRDIDFAPDGSLAWVTGEVDATVTVVDARTHRPLRTITMPPGARPMGVRVAGNGTRVYVSNGRGGTVSVLDARSDALLADIAVGVRPWGLALSADGGTLSPRTARRTTSR